MRTAVTKGIGGGQVVTGVGHFVKQRHDQQSGFLTRLQADADRFGTTVQVDAEQADGMGGTYRQMAETSEQPAGGITRQTLPNPGGNPLPDFKLYRHTAYGTI